MSPQWSDDRNWFWDGTRWNDALSQDGHYRFDGSAWQPYSGPRTSMPQPLSAAPATPPPHPAPPAAPAPDYPSWLASGEVSRLEQERVEHEQAVQAAALAPLPQPVAAPWANVHAEVLRQSGRRYTPAGSWWQVGAGSVIIYVVLLLFCFPACGVYVRWFTKWSSSGKLIGYGVLAVSWIVLFAIRMSNAA